MTFFSKAYNVSAPQALIMVGLPARGKTYIARKLTRYLNWVGLDTKVFNVGEYRRKAVPPHISQADFFDPENSQAKDIREKCAVEALEDMCTWLIAGGEVAVYDATNSSRERRQKIFDIIGQKNCIRTFFIESICSDNKIIEANIREVKVSSPDYQNTDNEDAFDDFRRRIAHYESIYEPLDEKYDTNFSFIKIFNQGKRYLVNQIQGHVESRVVYYLMNIHVLPRTIYITRHGEGDMNVRGQVGSDCDLTERGHEFSQHLAEFVQEEMEGRGSLRVWTSVMKQTLKTAEPIKGALMEKWKALGELDSGICEGMTYDEIKKNFPEVYKAREEDKFHYRYPGGESYQDLVVRLEPVILQLERLEDVMVIASQAVCRCIIAYFMDYDLDDLPYINTPLHTVFKLTPVAYGCKLDHISISPSPIVDTYRPRPQDVIRLTRQEMRQRRRQISECQEPECCGRVRLSSFG